jgi:hypothetical protein
MIAELQRLPDGGSHYRYPLVGRVDGRREYE